MSIDLSQFQAILLDLDGTVYHEDQALPGAIELIRHLQTSKRPFACLSNSTASPQRIVTRIQKMGGQLAPNQVYTAAAATADYILKRYPHARPRLYNLASESMPEMLHGRVDWIESPHDPCDAVIVGAAVSPQASEERRRVALYLLRHGAAAIGICADRVYPSPRGLEFGCGALTQMLCYASGVQPVYCGKPEKFFFQELCHRLGVEPQRCLLIGDNLESDLLGARNVAMRTILTLTGVACREDLKHLPDDAQPIGIVKDLTELLPLI